MAAFQNYEISRANWYGSEGWYDLVIALRTWPTVTGESSFLHFDGAVMQGYSHPSKASEVVFCRGNPGSKYCNNDAETPGSSDLPDPEEVLRHPFRAGDEFNPAAERHLPTIRSIPLRRILQKGKDMTISYLASGGEILSLVAGDGKTIHLNELKNKKES